MRQPAVPALALAAAAAVALASCGGGEDAKLLPGNTAQEITENLDRVKQYAEEGECVGAEDAVGEVDDQVEGLSGVDPKLLEALRRGTDRLSEVIATCEEEEPLETTESTEEDEERNEHARPPGQVKKEEREREAEEATPKDEEGEQENHGQGPPETTPAEPPAPPSGESGGTPSPGGVSPGTPVEPENSD